MVMRCALLACLVAAWAASPTASAFVFKAGGTGEWRVPAGANANATNAYNAWAQRNRFRVGDAVGESASAEPQPCLPAAAAAAAGFSPPADHRIE